MGSQPSARSGCAPIGFENEVLLQDLSVNVSGGCDGFTTNGWSVISGVPHGPF
jgi:hypothetical protein